ncbi:MAG: sortase [Chloroflexi bacterium]|nr:sortase [Chloroflexota bacterium]
MNRNRGSSAATLTQIIVFGVLLGAAFFVYDNWRSGMERAALPTAAPTATAQASATPPPTADLQAPLAATNALTPTTLFIPTQGILAPVIQVFLDGLSWDIRNLGTNVGHLQGTAWLDSPGNIVLSGHVEMSDGRLGVFASLNQLAQGDLIVLQHGSEERRYSVRSIGRVQPTDLSVLYPTLNEQLTLITCEDYDFFQNSYLERVVVVADRIQ